MRGILSKLLALFAALATVFLPVSNELRAGGGTLTFLTQNQVVVSGGIETTDGAFTVRTFNSSETLYVSGGEITVEYLLVAGGGSGGNGTGGGGGAGGLLHGSLTISSNVYSVIVGAGGIPGGVALSGLNGSDSTFSGMTALGGGGGGGSSRQGSSGGSGGGGGYALGGSGTTNQGHNGGSGSNDHPNQYPCGGGGGAGAVGGFSSENPETGGNGGNGLPFTITGTSVYYAGGGGGGVYLNTDGRGVAGSGGGGNGGGRIIVATNGTANTGGGGGGQGNDSLTPAGSGGSGVCIIRYLTPNTPQLAQGGEITEYSSNGVTHRVHTFRSSGTFQVLRGPLPVEYTLAGGTSTTENQQTGSSTLATNSYTAVVGGSDGDSIFNGITAVGGGGSNDGIVIISYPVETPTFVATGGIKTIPGDGFTYHTFNASDTFTVETGCRYVAVTAGTGDGISGGGTQSAISVVPGTYSVTAVGAVVIAYKTPGVSVSGGTVTSYSTTTSGITQTFEVHTFTSSGTLTVNGACDVSVVAATGDGIANGGTQTILLTTQAYTVTVGVGNTVTAQYQIKTP